MRKRTIFLISVAIIGATLAGFFLLDNFVFTFADSRPQLHVSEPQKNYTGDETVIGYKELTPEQQRVFERALETDSRDRTARIPSGVNNQVWVENRYVRYQNKTYTVGVIVE